MAGPDGLPERSAWALVALGLMLLLAVPSTGLFRRANAAASLQGKAGAFATSGIPADLATDLEMAREVGAEAATRGIPFAIELLGEDPVGSALTLGPRLRASIMDAAELRALAQGLRAPVAGTSTPPADGTGPRSIPWLLAGAGLAVAGAGVAATRKPRTAALALIIGIATLAVCATTSLPASAREADHTIERLGPIVTHANVRRASELTERLITTGSELASLLDRAVLERSGGDRAEADARVRAAMPELSASLPHVPSAVERLRALLAFARDITPDVQATHGVSLTLLVWATIVWASVVSVISGYALAGVPGSSFGWKRS